ncbi:hypothetical protein [Noviherbaspirillum saxi]|uniref:Uncharacterized protein n=1 Tax=Noviherbaspirillum saxi TaxID=2320863 RepID=A0A3A3FJB7_9BURK|nr:hypothetical protein [Noviherbaspirillum saxi]RJF95377.1 hypothetical protein D3871_18330 [Noviherbaspirillum saxi]
MRLEHIGIFSLLILGLANAFAEPGEARYVGREVVRAFQVQNAALDRGEYRNGQPVQGDRRRGRELNGQDTSGYGAPNDGRGSETADNSRRQGRLSPEERRALRRQIDEVGHDIYAPKR